MLTQAHLTFASPFNSEKIVKCFSLEQPIPTNHYSSNSVLLSLAAHVTFKFPYLDLTENTQNCPKIHPQTKQVNQYLTNHPLQQLWCDSFSQAIIKNHAIRKNNILYIVLELSNSQFTAVMQQKEKLSEFSIKYQKTWIDQLLKKITGYEQLPRKNKNIVYLNVSGSQLRKDPYMPIINVRAILLGQVYNNENWKSFNILKNEVPSIQEFLNVDGVIIPGSTNSVLSDIPQIQQMSGNLFKAFQINKKLKIFGICYGHQLVAHKNKGYVIKKRRTDKVEKYKFNQNLIKELKGSFTFLEKMINKETDTLLLQHHEDYVETVSDEFYVLASSQTSKVECQLHKTGRILSFQSHPEYFYQYSQGYMQRLMNYRYNDSSNSVTKKNEQNLMRLHHDSSIRMRMVLSQFLNWQVPNS